LATVDSNRSVDGFRSIFFSRIQNLLVKVKRSTPDIPLASGLISKFLGPVKQLYLAINKPALLSIKKLNRVIYGLVEQFNLNYAGRSAQTCQLKDVNALQSMIYGLFSKSF